MDNWWCPDRSFARKECILLVWACECVIDAKFLKPLASSMWPIEFNNGLERKNMWCLCHSSTSGGGRKLQHVHFVHVGSYILYHRWICQLVTGQNKNSSRPCCSACLGVLGPWTFVQSNRQTGTQVYFVLVTRVNVEKVTTTVHKFWFLLSLHILAGSLSA